MSIRDQLQKSPGYQEYQDMAASTPRRQYPWKTLAANIVGISAAHGLGYVGAGALTKALSKTNLGKRMARMPAAKQKRILGHIIGAAGTTGLVAHNLASMAGQARVAEEISRLENKRETARTSGSTKTASVYDIYASALREDLE